MQRLHLYCIVITPHITEPCAQVAADALCGPTFCSEEALQVKKKKKKKAKKGKKKKGKKKGKKNKKAEL